MVQIKATVVNTWTRDSFTYFLLSKQTSFSTVRKYFLSNSDASGLPKKKKKGFNMHVLFHVSISRNVMGKEMS